MPSLEDTSCKKNAATDNARIMAREREFREQSEVTPGSDTVALWRAMRRS
jgi:hypothetical protein